jgi:glutathione S-transferase
MAAIRPKTQSPPVLWQLEISHFNEKVRWALDYKRIPHIRRSLLPGPHALKAKRLTGDTDTTPVLTLDGSSIGDSTRIIGVIENRWPQPPLYPKDQGHLRRALELEEFFDEELGPHIRRAVYHELLAHPKMVIPLFSHGQRLPARWSVRAAFPILRFGMRRVLEINAPGAEESRAKTATAMDRLEQEIGSSGYLVGSSFTVADLTAAALFYPVVLPPEFPYPSVTDPPSTARAFLDPLAQRPGGRWVAEIYRKHRLPPAPSQRSPPCAAPGAASARSRSN